MKDIEILDKCEEYNYNHSLCPICFEEDFIETNLPFTDTFKNPNFHTCKKCGWKGLQKDLIPTKNRNT